jgi:hypothetical protein
MDDAASRLRDSLYTAVGFGVLGFQQFQLRRRDLQRDLAKLAAEVDERFDPVLDDLVARLPEDIRPVATQARAAAVSVRRTLLGQQTSGTGR